jgi:hypothetical protein
MDLQQLSEDVPLPGSFAPVPPAAGATPATLSNLLVHVTVPPGNVTETSFLVFTVCVNDVCNLTPSLACTISTMTSTPNDSAGGAACSSNSTIPIANSDQVSIQVTQAGLAIPTADVSWSMLFRRYANGDEPAAP